MYLKNLRICSIITKVLIRMQNLRQMETYRRGHNGTDSKSVCRIYPAHGFESHRLRLAYLQQNDQKTVKVLVNTPFFVFSIVIINNNISFKKVLFLIFLSQILSRRMIQYSVLKAPEFRGFLKLHISHYYSIHA